MQKPDRIRFACLPAIAAVLLTMGHGPAAADEAFAKQRLKAMSDYLSQQKAVSLDYDATLELVTADEQKVGLASSGSIALSRPDKIRATRANGFTDVELVFDGKTLSVLGKNANVFLQKEIPGTVDNLIDELRDKYQIPLPAADLLSTDPEKSLMDGVTNIKDLGSGYIGGKECDHFAFRAPEVDWQIWIAQGEQPYPCRYTITSKTVSAAPQYTIDVRSWRTGAEAGSDNFAFTAPAGATQLTVEKVTELGDIPAVFNPK
ncbi:MAG: DUF2092 domain-containing protein [Hyphomicrobiales bacterium]